MDSASSTNVSVSACMPVRVCARNTETRRRDWTHPRPVNPYSPAPFTCQALEEKRRKGKGKKSGKDENKKKRRKSKEAVHTKH